MDFKRNKKTAVLGENQNGDHEIIIRFPEHDLDALFQVRSIPERKYKKEERKWSAPLSASNILLLEGFGFEIDNKLDSFLQKTRNRESEIIREGIPGLKTSLLPFQSKAVAFIENNNGRALINDEVGLGKTIMALAWLQLHSELRPVLIVVPDAYKLFWKNEAERLLSNPKTELLSVKKSPWQPIGDILIISYYDINDWVNQLKAIMPQIIILDEIHNIRDKTAKQTKAVQKIAKGVPNIICLTSISVVAHPLEAFNAIKLIKSDLVPSFSEFSKRYTDTKPTYYTWEDYGVKADNKSTGSREKKLSDFISWLKEQIDNGLIEIGTIDQVGSGIEPEWTNTVIVDSYKRKELRSRYGGEKGILNAPFHIDRVGSIFTQVFSDLKGITEPIDAVISRILAQGMVDGEGPASLARKIEAAINGTGLGDLGITNEFIAETIISAKRRAKMIAHTEMIRAYHKSHMNQLKNWRDLGINAKVEWVTAGDNRVCDLCKALEGRIFTVEEIEDLIPLHPECRCIGLEYLDELQQYLDKPKEKIDWLGQREGISTKYSAIEGLYNDLTGTIMIRRLRSDVLSDMPHIMFSFIPVEADNINEYKIQEAAFVSYLNMESDQRHENKTVNQESTYVKNLVRLTSKGKLRQTTGWIKDFLEFGNKLLLLTNNLFVVDSLIKSFGKASLKLDSTDSSSQIQAKADDFTYNKQLRLLICELETFEANVKLSTINHLAFYELPWDQSQLKQTERILRRIEPDKKVNSYFFFANDSIEEKVASVLQRNMLSHSPSSVNPQLLWNEVLMKFQTSTT